MSAKSTVPGSLGRYAYCVNAAGATISEVHYSGGIAEPLHYHTGAYFVLTLDGELNAYADEGSQNCRARSLIALFPGVVHRYHYLQNVRTWQVEISPAHWERLRPQLSSDRRLQHFRTNDAASVLAARMFTEFTRKARGWELSLEGMMLELMAALLRAPEGGKSAPMWVVEAHALIKSGFRQPISIKQVAAQIGAHPVSLARAFRHSYGVSPSQYLIHLRLESARAALSQSDASLSEIALGAGFFDQSQFTTHFRHHFGVTPKRYRNGLGQT